jgi:hypothetical protein
MAVVGEAHIIVRAITTSVKDDIKKGFQGVDNAVADSGKRISKAFSDDFASGAEAAQKAFQRLVKTGYVLQTALGTIVGGLASLVGAAGALAGALGGAAGSVAAFSGVIAALPAGMATFKLALGGVGAAVSRAVQNNKNYSNSLQEARDQLKQLAFDAEAAALSQRRAGLTLEQARENLLAAQQLPPNSRARREAELAYEEADLAYRRAMEQQKAAEKAKKKGAGAGAGQEDPFADLNESQKKFAKYLVTLQPLIKRLKESASAAFLPILQEQIDRLVNGSKGVATFFEVINDGIRRTSTGLGSGVTAFVNALTNPKNLKNLKDVFKGIQPVFETMGKVFGSLFGSFLTITKAALPATQKLLSFIESKASVFENFLDTKAKTGELTAFFNRATKLAGDFGQILGNIGSFFGDIIEANFGPSSGGQYLLNWLKTATAGWKTLDDRVGKSEFSNYFFSASVNAKAVLQSIGKLVKELGKLGSDRAIKETFDILAEGAPFIGKILSEGIKAGPVLARLIVNITRIVASLSDSGSIRVFFDILARAAGALADILENEVVQTLLKVIATIAAVKYAVNTLKGVFVFAGNVMAGSLLPIIARFKGIEVAALKAQITGSKFFSIAKKGGGWLTLLFGLVEGGIALNNELIRTRKEALTSAETIRGLFNNENVSSVNSLKDAFGDLSGTLTFSNTTVKNNIATTKRYIYSIDDLASNAETFKQTITLIANESDRLARVDVGTQDWFDDEEQWYRVEENFLNIGKALSDIALSDLPTAQKRFQDMVKQFQLTDEEAGFLLESLGPEFKDALTQLASNAQLSTGNMTLLDIVMGKGANSADAIAVQLYGVEGAAEASRKRVQGLVEELLDFGSVELDTRAAAREFEAAIDAVTESIAENGRTLDITTEAGRANNAVLDSMVQAGKDNATTLFQQDLNAEKLEGRLVALRKKVEDSAIAMGASKTAAKKLADQLVGDQYKIKITVDEVTKEQINAAIKDVQAFLKGSGFRLTPAEIAAMQAGTLAIPKINDKGKNSRYGGYVNVFGSGIPRFAPGGPVFGPGTGTSDSIPAMLSNGEFVVNARSTAKNRSLLEAINSGQSSTSNGANVNIVVNSAPGMDVNELTAEISRRLSFNLRKGASI